MSILAIPSGFVAGAAVGSLGLNALFHTVRRKSAINSEKQLAWVLTFPTCVVVTIGSIKYIAFALANGFDVTRIIYSDPFSLVLLGFFCSYLVWDLILGHMYYRSTINLVTGYIHHTLFICMSVFAAKQGVSAIFCLLFYNELPTILLALGNLRKEWRCDKLFAITFFSTRIALHAMLIMEFFQHSELRFLWKLMFLVMPMHLYWFYGAMRGQMRRRKLRAVQYARSSRCD
ncbi:hypothetical protein IW140_002391 [Coemansia sp. RSA 1813]|nr:hypothetical protein EV178_000891 [Coemansia sp. RSA 1646]KAJ1772995.1 hypothetical protein LPJ74_000946 [Coemansia sp. RSA 1843]KAJ2092228.1 hypothetical protein IW138_001295 [Coemansia sp. RSA 986]KAJ2211346.1 hypothetical protein EV179_005574 [Coemansia sp. RSA 487]KAJ2570298.1 hypothetical protein IW140_002391 [Coemansia sp. RSA 1813]